MFWRRVCTLLFAVGNAYAADAYIVGAGLEADSSDGFAGSLLADVALSEKTWLSGGLARNTVDLPRLQSIETWYADVGMDHWFDPVGLRLGAAYWGDSDILDSRDWRGSVYGRRKSVTLAVDYEYRDFRFELPDTDQFRGRTVRFDAQGIGFSTRFDLTDKVNLGVEAMDYDYSVDLSLDRNRGILELLSFSRLSLINSLVDYRVLASIGIDVDERRWQFEAGTRKGEVDGGLTRSATIRFLTPVGKSSDVEFGFGVDDSDLYGSVTFFSVFLYFYGET